MNYNTEIIFKIRTNPRKDMCFCRNGRSFSLQCPQFIVVKRETLLSLIGVKRIFYHNLEIYFLRSYAESYCIFSTYSRDNYSLYSLYRETNS